MKVTSNQPCPGGTLQLYTQAQPVAYSWTGPNGFTSSLQNPAVTNVQNANAGIYRLTATETGCPSQEDSVAVQFHFSAITSQPANSRVCIGSNAYFKVTAGGNDLSYQWQTYNNGWTNLTENTTYNGTKTPTLSVLADSTMFCKSFRCMISSGCYPTIISDSGALRVGIIYPSINIDTNSCSPGIQITSLSTLTLCTKDSLEIHYIYRGGIDCGTDSISAELSDASGSFAAAIVLGKKAFDLTGTMKVLIPCGTLTGSGYRVRMVLSKPTLTSADNGSNIAISDCIPALSISSNSPVCQGSMLMLTSSAQTNYNWYYSPASWLFSHLQNPSVTSASSGYYKLSVNWACGTKSDSTFVNIIPPPKIYGIVPDNGITGSQVNIYGTGFNPVIANNTLYMGTALASITSIPDTNHIIASAQVNATDAPLTLIDKQCALSANLPNQFFLTDPCPKPLNASTTYAAAVSFSLGSVTASNIHTAIGDLDGDGKLDIVVRNAGSGIVQIFHNTSTSGSINPSSFAAPVNLTGGTITGNEEIKLVDLDNDGKLDILCNNNQIGSSNIAIWRNISTPGTINASSFASPMLIGTSFPPSTALSIGDINQDGKMDFVVGDPSENAIAVFLNYSQPGSLNIVNNCFISTTSARPTKALALIDIDGDQFPDLIQLCSNGKVSVYKGGVSCTGFQPPIDFNTLGNPTTLAVADLDKDNKPDIIVGYGPASTGFSYFRNTTNYYSYPYITFATRTDVSTTAPVVRITTGDATGDAKTDLLFANNNNSNTGNTFTIYPNTSSAPTISFGTPVSFTCGTAPHMVSLADLDGSGTKDIVVSFIGTNSIQVFRNQTNPAILPVITAGGPTDFCTGGNVTLTCSVAASYLWSTGATTRSITVSNTGSYWVRANGCEISLSTQVNVRNYPASFSVSGGGSYCSASGTGVPVNLSGSQTGVKYQLLLNAVSSGSPLSGTGSALSFGNQLSAGTYTVVATTDSSTCSTTMTGNATLTINNSPAAFTISGGGIYCSPSQTSLHVTLNGSQTGVNYQLKQNGTISIGSPLSGTGSGLNFGSQDSGIYTIAATAGNGCELTMTGSATITRYTDPAIFNISGGGNFCSYPGSGVSVQLSSSQPGILYTLLRNGINQTSTGLTGTGGILSFSNITDTGVYNMRASNVTSGCYTFMNSNATVSMTQSTRFYRDYDLDGYGDQYNYIDTCASSIPGYIINGGDCNDSSNMVHPGVMEICDNGVDDNCDTYIDENCRIYLFLAVYIEGFYLGNGQMQAILYNNDQATYPSMACDSITIELHADTSPYDLIATANGLLDVYGNVIVQFPSSLMNGSYFIALRHRNSIETWSKDPVLFNSLVTSFDFTNQ
ncbi:MAG: FG-GAP-like repeat-containing protein [Bacteroidetes bacterium]|nr:FG-GAP-like repeat-containing protein [Bacteroidota bacterium]